MSLLKAKKSLRSRIKDAQTEIGIYTKVQDKINYCVNNTEAKAVDPQQYCYIFCSNNSKMYIEV